MSFSITEFSAQISKMGLAKTNLFFVRISLPRSLQFLEEKLDSRDLVFLCKTVDLPSFDVQYMQLKNYTTGPLEYRPMSMDFQPLSTIFMVDSNFGVLSFFHRWMQAIYNYNADGGLTTVDSQNKKPYELEYKENYAATIDIIVYSGMNGDKIYSYKLSNAYPITVQHITTSWENQNEIMTLPVVFAYDRMSVVGSELGKVQDYMGGNSLFNYINSIDSFNQAIKNRSPQDVQDFINRMTNVSQIFNSL